MIGFDKFGLRCGYLRFFRIIGLGLGISLVLIRWFSSAGHVWVWQGWVWQDLVWHCLPRVCVHSKCSIKIDEVANAVVNT